jgi:hypothetical protein
MWKWTHNNPRYFSKYHHNYCCGKWNTSIEKGFPPFPPPHLGQVDILIIRDDFQTLVDIVILDPIRMNMKFHALSMTMHAMMVAT